MRKRRRKFAKILALFVTGFSLLLLFIVIKTLPEMFFDTGKAAYDRGDYKRAYISLKQALMFNYKNIDARYFYVETLLKFPPTLQVQKDMFKISQVNLPDSADLIADRQVSKWRDQITQNFGNNYIEQVPFNSKVLRWDLDKLPLTVSVTNDSSSQAPDYYLSAIKAAFIQWQNSTDGMLRFKFIQNPADANIEVKIIPLDKNNCNQKDCKYVVAYTSPVIKDNLLKKMTIDFYDSNNLSQPFTQKEVYNTALHEIGHSLGIMGHSYEKDNLMFMEQGPEDNAELFRESKRFIQPADLNTLRLLYALIPDTSNTPIEEFDVKHQFYAPIVLGSEKEMSSRKIIEAKNYIKKAPGLPNGYIDLASAYSEQDEYNSALETLNKALSLSTNDSEKFVIYYNSAVIYMNIKDWDNALKYAQMAKQVQSAGSNDTDELIQGIEHNRSISR